MADRFRWDPADFDRPPSLILEPLRLTVLIGTTVALAGAAMPWAHGRDSYGYQTFKPLFEGDGVLLVAAIIVLVGLTLSRGAAESRTRTVQAGPAVAGFVALTAWASAVQTRDALFAQRNALWTGDGDVGMGVCAVGIAVLVVAAAALSISSWRRNGAAPDPSAVRLTARTALAVLIEIAAGVLGVGVGMALVLNLLGVYGLYLMVIAALAGGGLGMALGERIAKAL